MMNGPDDFVGPVNLGNPDEFTILELAKLVIELTGSQSKIVHKDLPVDDPTRRQPDITLARRNSAGSRACRFAKGWRRRSPGSARSGGKSTARDAELLRQGEPVDAISSCRSPRLILRSHRSAISEEHSQAAPRSRRRSSPKCCCRGRRAICVHSSSAAYSHEHEPNDHQVAPW